jgi:hypothetical protein
MLNPHTRARVTEMHEATQQSRRWWQINSAMAGIANAIELCEAAKLPAITDALLSLQNAALREREQA